MLPVLARQGQTYAGAVSPSTTAPQALTRKGRQTRSRIVATAAGLMFEQGVARTSTEDVRAAAKISNSQLYHYFPGKSALVRAVIDHQTEAVLAGQEPLLSRLDSVEALVAWRDLFVEGQRRRLCLGGCPLGSLVGELAETDDAARTALAEGFLRWHDKIAEGLRAMCQRGDLPAEADPDRLARGLLGAVQGGLLLAQTTRDATALADVLDVAIGHLRCLASASGSVTSGLPGPPATDQPHRPGTSFGP